VLATLTTLFCARVFYTPSLTVSETFAASNPSLYPTFIPLNRTSDYDRTMATGYLPVAMPIPCPRCEKPLNQFASSIKHLREDHVKPEQKLPTPAELNYFNAVQCINCAMCYPRNTNGSTRKHNPCIRPEWLPPNPSLSQAAPSAHSGPLSSQQQSQSQHQQSQQPSQQYSQQHSQQYSQQHSQQHSQQQQQPVDEQLDDQPPADHVEQPVQQELQMQQDQHEPMEQPDPLEPVPTPIFASRILAYVNAAVNLQNVLDAVDSGDEPATDRFLAVFMNQSISKTYKDPKPDDPVHGPNPEPVPGVGFLSSIWHKCKQSMRELADGQIGRAMRKLLSIGHTDVSQPGTRANILSKYPERLPNSMDLQCPATSPDEVPDISLGPDRVDALRQGQAHCFRPKPVVLRRHAGHVPRKQEAQQPPCARLLPSELCNLR